MFQQSISHNNICLLRDFYMVQINLIEANGNIIKRFPPKLTKRQEELLRLANVPINVYQ